MLAVKHILFPLDFSDRACAAVPFVEAMAGRFGAKVTLASIPPAFTVFAVLLVIGGITYLFAMETKGRSLDSI